MTTPNSPREVAETPAETPKDLRKEAAIHTRRANECADKTTAEENRKYAAELRARADAMERATWDACGNCRGTGYYGDNGPGIKGNREYVRCECGAIPKEERARVDAVHAPFGDQMRTCAVCGQFKVDHTPTTHRCFPGSPEYFEPAAAPAPTPDQPSAPVAKWTRGPVRREDSGGGEGDIYITSPNGGNEGYYVAKTYGPDAESNADLIVEAFNVATETGKTPRELAEELSETQRLREEWVRHWKAASNEAVKAIKERDTLAAEVERLKEELKSSRALNARAGNLVSKGVVIRQDSDLGESLARAYTNACQ